MLTTLTLRNFKSIREQRYDFTQFDLLVGRNNSGKSTILQALAIWQFAVDQFRGMRRTGASGIQVVLPNFTALPVPEFNLLWRDRLPRSNPQVDGERKPSYILIEIDVAWRHSDGKNYSFMVQLRHQSPQAVYAIPFGGWAAFRKLEDLGCLPRIAYVPPFSGLEPAEKRLDEAPRRQQVGKGQPGSVLRNLLIEVCPNPPVDANGKAPKGYLVPADWVELERVVGLWFGVELCQPRYDPSRDVFIRVDYKQRKKEFDIIAGGSGFHQVLTLLAFLYGYRPTTILLDEPDAHLHANLQREILDYFKRKSAERGTQFLVATHAEEFVNGVDPSQIISLLARRPTRIKLVPRVVKAMADLRNDELTEYRSAHVIVYVEGQTDERLLRAWAPQCGAGGVIDSVAFKTMNGGNKKRMRDEADAHFAAVLEVVPGTKKLVLLDRDDAPLAPAVDNPVLIEWGRRNIENYLLVPDAWHRAALQKLEGATEGRLFDSPANQVITEFFADQGLVLPKGRNWRTLAAESFSAVDGKRLLFDGDRSLFQLLRAGTPGVDVLREEVAQAMKPDEIHADVHAFMARLVTLAPKPREADHGE